jgi:hypothetical protein
LASFFAENNLEFVESEILDFPKEGYDNIESFIKKFPEANKYTRQVLGTNSRIFQLKSQLHDENIIAELETLVILDISNQSKVLNRNFNL